MLPSRYWKLITGRQETATLCTINQKDGSLANSFLLWDSGTGAPEYLTGNWDDTADKLAFDDQYGPRDVDNYVGFLVANPVDGTIGLAGTVKSYSGGANPEIGGWYALAEASYDPEDSGFEVPTLADGEPPDVPAGSWHFISRVIVGSWSRLVLNIDSNGAVTGTLNARPIAGSWDPIWGQLRIRYDFVDPSGFIAPGHTIYTGYTILNYLGQIVAMAGILEEYSVNPTPDLTAGWYATRQHTRPILETTWPNDVSFPGVAPDTSKVNWASMLVGGKTFLENDTPIFEWVPVTRPVPSKGTNYNLLADATLDELPDLTAVCGSVVAAHVSEQDLPFSHPFGTQNDYNFDVAPEHQYWPLLAVSNVDLRTRASWFRYDPELAAGMDIATARGREEFNLDVPGLMHVEVDSALIPERFRPTVGDQVLLFGRWIVDAGHDDFGSEIHPSLLTVRAFLPTLDDGRDTPDVNTVVSTLAWCPFVVGQTYSYDGDGNPQGLRGHFLQHLTDLVPHVSFLHVDTSAQIELSAPILVPPLPSRRRPVTFFLRPQAPRLAEGDVLLVSWSLTVRPGVHVDISSPGEDSVLVSFWAEDSYQPSDPPGPSGRRTVFLSEFPSDVQNRIRQEVFQRGEDAVASFGGGIVPPDTPQNLVAVVDNGALMNLYGEIPAASPVDGTADVKDQPVEQLDAVRGRVAVDGGQPRSVYGSISVRWKRAGST